MSYNCNKYNNKGEYVFMNCPNCGRELLPGASFCPECGASISGAAPSPSSRPSPANRYTSQSLPSNYAPLSPWAYFGLQILFSIPLVGFILAIIFSLDDTNINRRNFARSYWCGLIVAVILIVIFAIIGGSAFSAIINNLR